MKWKFLIITESYDMYGTNDEELAIKMAEWAQVYNVVDGLQLAIPDDTRHPSALVIKECKDDFPG